MLKEIPGRYKGRYSITDSGEVWSHKRNQWLKPKLNKKTGYYQVNLGIGITITETIHRLVLLAHVGPDSDPAKCDVDHIDGNKLNNNLDNLRWVTTSENLQNRKAKGWKKKGNKYESFIGVDYKKIYLGRSDTEEEAHQSYLDAKKIHHPTSPINK